MTVTTAPALRCSAWTRSQSVDPVGSAGHYRGFLLVETPLPWPRDIGEIPALQPVARLAAARGYRLQALVPTDPDRPARVVVHAPAEPAGEEGWFAGYRRVEVEGGEVAATAEALIDSTADVPAGPTEQTDLLVCTHGRRDVCCGSQGTELARDLVGSDLPAAGVNVRRTSHTGGHRFAPTFLLLPQGTMWAYADPEVASQVVHRSLPFADLAGHYRGCAGLGPAPVQALERAVLVEEGWDLLDRRRRGCAVEAASGRFRLETDGAAWEATVLPGRTLPVPECMKPLTESRKTETEWAVSDLQRV